MEYLPISELFDMEKGVLQSSKCTPGPYPFITAADEWKTHKEYSHDKEALLFAAAASGSLGRTHYVKGKFISSDLCFILTPKDPSQRPIDLQLYQFIFQQFQSDIVARTKGGTSKESISQRSLGEYRLPYISIDRQKAAMRKMVAVRAKKEALTTELTHQRALLKQLRQAILQEAVQGKLTEAWRGSHPELVSGPHHASELLKRIRAEKEALVKAGKLRKPKPLPPIKPEEVPFELPEGWVWCRFGSYAQFERGKFSARPRNDKRFFGGAYPFIQIGSLDERGSVITSFSQTLNEEGLCMSKMFPAGTITIAIVGGTIGNLGVLGTDMCFTDSIVGVRPSPVTCQEYILLLLRSRQPDIRTAAYQHAGQPNISLPNFTELLIPLPPIPEQLVIVEQVEILVTRLDELERELDASCAVSDSLLQSVLSEVMGGPGAVRYAEAGGELPLAAEPQVRQGRATKASTQVHEGH